MPIDMSAAVKAPPRRTPRKQATPAARATTPPPPMDDRPSLQRRTEGLVGLGQGVQGVFLVTRQYADAANMGRNFPPLAAELAKLAEQFEVVAKPIDFLIEIGPFAGVIVAATPLILQFMANHHMVDASGMAGMNVVPPEVLEAQMKAELLRMQAAAIRQQQEAEMEIREAEAEYQRVMAMDEEKAATPA